MNASTESDATTTLHHSNHGEKRGERKMARQVATAARHQAQQELEIRNATPPANISDAAQRWDEFYATKPTLFKDRHLLRTIFPDLVSPTAAANPRKHVAPLTADAQVLKPDLFLLEAGCGTGNTVFPLLRANPRLFVVAFDFSSTAVETLKSSPEFRHDRVHAFVADAARADTYLATLRRFSSAGADFVTAFWTLSALPATARRAAAAGLADALADTPDAALFVRDYAIGDMREQAFAARGRQVREDQRLFLRGDGTYAYFFSVDEVTELFESVGLVCDFCNYEERKVHNRKEALTMCRRWVHAKFSKDKKNEESGQPPR